MRNRHADFSSNSMDRPEQCHTHRAVVRVRQAQHQRLPLALIYSFGFCTERACLGNGCLAPPSAAHDPSRTRKLLTRFVTQSGRCESLTGGPQGWVPQMSRKLTTFAREWLSALAESQLAQAARMRGVAALPRTSASSNSAEAIARSSAARSSLAVSRVSSIPARAPGSRPILMKSRVMTSAAGAWRA
jgi:hypothetical protein